MRCPLCGAEARLPENSRRNMENYQQSCVTVTLCCGGLVHASPVTTFRLSECSGRTEDDWGRAPAQRRPRQSAQERP